MQSKQFIKAGVLTLVLGIAFITSWELYWRYRGFEPTYNDDKVLWAATRSKVYQPIDKTTVFIGSSRIKFDLDIPTWEKETGEQAIQLALVGTSPRKILQNLANDPKFTGKVVVDVTEPLFFSLNPFFNKSADEAIAYYKDQTPTEKFSSRVNAVLESRMVFLEENKFSLNMLLEDLEIPSRPGVFMMPPFPKGFEMTLPTRQTYMSNDFLADTQLINRQTAIWNILVMGNPAPPLSGEPLQAIMNEVASDVKKIESKGGRVVFVRTPSSGPMGAAEQKGFPRNIYWDPLLATAKAKGIHYADNPATAKLICPEWSHLSLSDAAYYTKQFIRELQQEDWFRSDKKN